MNKNLSLAIEEAVRNFPPKNEIKDKDLDKRPDLFSLTQETELYQNDKGITVKINRSKDSNLTNFGKATLSDRYLGFNESFQDLFARVASTYADNNLHGQRIYNYISDLWFMPATPILSNGGTKRGLPISCFDGKLLTASSIAKDRFLFIKITILLRFYVKSTICCMYNA